MENEELVMDLSEVIPDETVQKTEPVPETETVPAAEGTLTEFVKAEVTVPAVDESKFSPKELALAEEFAKKIDLYNSSQVLQFGSSSQKKISEFSDTVLANVKTKDMDEVGNMITGLVGQLKGFSGDAEKKPGLFQSMKGKLAETKAKFETVEKNIDKICSSLETHKATLLKDTAMLDMMYQKNVAYYKELSLYILAGRKKLEETLKIDLPELQDKARRTGNMEDAMAANNLADMCNRFDKKLHDLDLTRTVSMQMGPQIRLIQSTDNIMVEKIQSSIVNTIPLWKNQMVLALGMAHSKNAIAAQREVTDMTNTLLKKNADALKMNSIDAAKESERGIIDIETLKYTNQSLISTLDEVLKIQTDGRQKRREAEKELRVIESDMKNKLLELSNHN
jgi:uncharacterized protein YaaN involved in tellurite resistance